MRTTRSRLFPATALALLLAGCATGGTRPAPPTAEELVSLAAQGVPATTLVERMRAGRGLYALSGSELAALGARGVPPEVLDYMQRTYIEAQVARERLRWSDPFYGPWGAGGYWRHPAFMFGPGPYGFGPWY